MRDRAAAVPLCSKYKQLFHEKQHLNGRIFAISPFFLYFKAIPPEVTARAGAGFAANRRHRTTEKPRRARMIERERPAQYMRETTRHATRGQRKTGQEAAPGLPPAKWP